MANSSGVSGFGTTLSSATITGGTVGTYADIAEVVKIGFGEMSMGSVNLTNHQSPDGVEELKPSGSLKIDETELTLNFISDTQISGFQSDMADGVEKSWKITFGNTAELVFKGWVSSIKTASADAQSPEALTFDVKIQPTSKPVFS